MPTREDPAQRGRRRAARLSVEIGQELRLARRAAGLSQATAGRRAGLSQNNVSRIERGATDGKVGTLAVLGAVVGLDLALRFYPGATPLRDKGHLHLLGRLQALLSTAMPHSPTWRTEVPIPIPGDQRAIDALLVLDGARVGFELETRLVDAQALARRATLKTRDAGLRSMILVVADTRANRTALAIAAPTLLPVFPLDPRQTMNALRVGEAPPHNGILVV